MTQQISKSIIVNAPVHHVYNLWSDFSNFPYFMEYVRSIDVTGPDTSHWVVGGPLGTNIDWNAKITRQEIDSRIAWNTKDNKGMVTTSGQVTFNPFSENLTEVAVAMQVSPPGGAVGDWIAGFLVQPEETIVSDLRRFKEYSETTAVT